MVFLIVDTDNYDVFLGLDFLMKIGMVVDVEKGVIQVRNGPSVEIELLPLTIFNMLQPISEQKSSHHVQDIAKGIWGLSLMEQPQLETFIPNNPDDDQEFDSSMNEFGSERKDDHDKILHENTLLMEDMMDQGLDDLIRDEAPTQIINLILQQQL
jgi:hypothetical protein